MFVLVAGLLAIAACGSGEPELPYTTADSMVAYLDDVDYQDSWKLWSGLGEKYEGGDPHGMLLTTYLNPAAYDALTGKDRVMPEGAVIVKEIYTPEGELAATTTMYKKSGCNAEAATLIITTGSGSRCWPMELSISRARWKAARLATGKWRTTTTSGPGSLTSTSGSG